MNNVPDAATHYIEEHGVKTYFKFDGFCWYIYKLTSWKWLFVTSTDIKSMQKISSLDPIENVSDVISKVQVIRDEVKNHLNQLDKLIDNLKEIERG